MNILIADDEKPARRELSYMLQQLAPNATIHEARNGQEALQVVAQQPVDVAFLDINMPGLNGIGVAAVLAEKPNPPLIVFATAYDAHAVRAFELAALDYLLKPFSDQRLAQTLMRIHQVLNERQMLAYEHYAQRQKVQEYVRATAGGSASAATPITKLWCERENKTAVLVDYANLLWLEAQEKHVYAQTVNGERLAVGYTLSELEERLNPHRIIRVHKGYLVNLDHVAEVVPWFSGAYLLRINDAKRSEIPMSRQYAKEMKERIL